MMQDKVSSKAEQIGSPEAIAYQLMQYILEVHGRNAAAQGSSQNLSRNVILDTYAECLDTVKGNRERRSARAAGQD